jgi:hypothetical protein
MSQRVQVELQVFAGHIGPVVWAKPPSLAAKRAPFLRHRQVEDGFVLEELQSPAAPTDAPQVDAGADHRERVDGRRAQILPQRSQLLKGSPWSIGGHQCSRATPFQIHKKVTLFRRCCLGQRKQCGIDSQFELSHLSNFEAAHALNDSWGEAFAEQRQAISLAFKPSRQNENQIHRRRLIVTDQGPADRLEEQRTTPFPVRRRSRPAKQNKPMADLARRISRHGGLPLPGRPHGFERPEPG